MGLRSTGPVIKQNSVIPFVTLNHKRSLFGVIAVNLFHCHAFSYVICSSALSLAGKTCLNSLHSGELKCMLGNLSSAVFFKIDFSKKIIQNIPSVSVKQFESKSGLTLCWATDLGPLYTVWNGYQQTANSQAKSST